MTHPPFYVHQPPAFTDPRQVTSAPYRREPYARVRLPDGSTLDAKAVRFSPTHLLLSWRDHPGAAPSQMWVPRAWAHRIPREQSSYQDPDDLL